MGVVKSAVLAVTYAIFEFCTAYAGMSPSVIEAPYAQLEPVTAVAMALVGEGLSEGLDEPDVF
jgi:hypothetical protein